MKQRLWLCLGEHRADALPTDPVELRRVARSLGFDDGEELLARYREIFDELVERSRSLAGQDFNVLLGGIVDEHGDLTADAGHPKVGGRARPMTGNPSATILVVDDRDACLR